VDRYCELVLALDMAGAEAFAELETDTTATDEDYAAAERQFLEDHQEQFDELRRVAPEEIASDVGVLLDAQEERAAGGEQEEVSDEVEAAEERIGAFEDEHCTAPGASAPTTEAVPPVGATPASAPLNDQPADTTAGATTGAETPVTSTAGAPATTMVAQTTLVAETVVPPETGSVEPVTVYDDEGDEVATITVLSVDTDWADYATDDAPEGGREYVRVTVNVEGLDPDEAFGVNVDDFVLQDMHGRITTAENVRTAQQVDDDEELPGEGELDENEAVELALTFQVVANVGPETVFYRPDEDHIVELVSLS
jgi:hypothetical protein